MLLEDILIQAGVDYKPARGQPDDVVMTCPFCTGSHDTSGERRVFGVNLVTGQAHCHRCLEANELVWTSRGIIPIREVDVGDSVPDMFGTMQRVLDVSRQRRSVIGIALKGFKEPLRLTEDHTCIIVTRGEARRTLPFIITRKNGLAFVGCRRQDPKSNAPRVAQIQAADVKNGDFFVFPVYSEYVRRCEPLYNSDVIRPYTRGPRTPRIDKLPVNKKTARLYGLWLAEGSAPSRGRVARWSFNADETQTLAAEVVSVLRSEFGLTATVIVDGNSCEVFCSKTDLGKQLKFWFGAGASGKKIPFEALMWPSEIQAALFEGYMDGDGGSGGQAGTVSRELASGLYALGIQCGKPVTVSRRDGFVDADGVNHRECWLLYRHLVEGLGGFYERIGDTKFYWSVVSAIYDEFDAAVEVVDLTIAGTATFLSKMGATHNCDWKSRTVVYTARALCEAFGIDFSWRLRLSATEADVEVSREAPEPVELLPTGLPPEYEQFRDGSDDIEFAARRYLKLRHITQQEIEEYQIGYAAVGDMAWRIIFPVFGEDGEIYGCAGRDFSGLSKLKYRNSEGLKLLFNAQHKAKRAVVVEGPVDTLAVGRVLAREFPGTVAVGALGSAITEQQLAQLAKYDSVIQFPDFDVPGIKGAVSRAEACDNVGIETYIIEPTAMDGSDPGDMKHDQIAQCIRSARPWSKAQKMRMRLRALL